MKVALIPPASLLNLTAVQPLHMVIPEGLKVRTYAEFYRDHYRILNANLNSTVMLDNGAYEEASGKSMHNDHLVWLVYDLKADILVLPDAMRDQNETIRLVESFMHYWDIYHALMIPRPVQFMGVVQGTSLSEMKDCVARYVGIEERFEISIMLGLSKWTTAEIEPEARIKMAYWINDHCAHPIHFLGMSRIWPKEILYAAQAVPDLITSVDATAPFTYTMAGLKLGVDESPGRPKNYFGADVDHVDAGLLNANLQTLRNWANGQDA